MASFYIPTQRNASRSIQKDDLPAQTISDFYEERKKIIFNKMDITKNEDFFFNFLKRSQKNLNKNSNNCLKSGFFQIVASDIYDLSNNLKENISNYCLVFSLYFIKKEYFKALKLFLLMCEQNKNSIIYITTKILELLPKISNNNRIAKYYPTITKTMLEILGIFIKLSGKFSKSPYENYYIKLYFKIVHVLSTTVIKYNPSNTDEINNQLKNERRYFYSSCLFDSSIYLFNRFQPLSVSIYILQHILDLYGNKLTFAPNEIESILLLKINFNLGLFYYIDGYNNEAINNLNQARDRLLEIKYFPISQIKKINTSGDNNNINTNSTNHLLNFNEFFADFKNLKFSRNKFKRTSVNSCTCIHNDKNSFDKDTLIAKIKEKNLQKYEYNYKIDFRKKQLSTIYLGANSLLTFQNPILVEQVKEKILVEIELLLSEIELNHKNYRESLNHINAILTMQSTNNFDSYIYNKNNSENLYSKKINKSKTLFNLTKNTTTSNGINDSNENKINENKFIPNLKNSVPSDSNLIWVIKNKKTDNSNINCISNINKKINKINTLKYHLSSSDKNRIMLILDQIEKAKNGNQNNESCTKLRLKYNRNLIKRNESLNKDKKIITSKEMEKFFVFICSLSVYQLKILNESQPEPSQRRNDLPIIFNNQFQDCLTNAQRMSLSVLETMSLSRYIILKDTDKDIVPENLDYRFMKYRIKETDSDDEYFSKLKKKSNGYKSELPKRKPSNESNASINTQNNNYESKKNLIKKKYKIQIENESYNIDLLLNNIKNEENKNFIDLHKSSVMKLLNQMSKEELRMILNSPKLLTKMIDNIANKYLIKENGGNNNNISNFFIEHKKSHKDGI